MALRPSLLVVEDDASVREAVALALSHLGCEVILVETGSGEEALQLIDTVPRLDGLYTDIRLSGRVTGWVVGRTFSQRWPSSPVVYASAACRKPPVVQGGVFLRKPFDMTALERVFSCLPARTDSN